ncbi:hypothetical protein D030_3083A, partial [Vibrio parahaemolyticus AQ3810]
MIDQVLITRI